jgi:hypothetical protein
LYTALQVVAIGASLAVAGMLLKGSEDSSKMALVAISLWAPLVWVSYRKLRLEVQLMHHCIHSGKETE